MSDAVASYDTIHWLAIRGGFSDRQVMAARRLQDRFNNHADNFGDDVKCLGPGLDSIVIRVVMNRHGLREAEAALGWPARSGKIVLGIALDRLADHYAIAAGSGTAKAPQAVECEASQSGPQGIAQPHSAKDS